MPSSTTYSPVRITDLDPLNISGDAQAVAGLATLGTTTNYDITLADDEIFTGAALIVDNATLGDYIVLLILSSGTPIANPVQKWYLPVSGILDYTAVMPKKVPAGLTLRVVYHSTGGILAPIPFLAINYKLWKVLI